MNLTKDIGRRLERAAEIREAGYREAVERLRAGQIQQPQAVRTLRSVYRKAALQERGAHA